MLMREQAARLELMMLVCSLALLFIVGGRFSDYLVITILHCVLFSIEALNTAVEMLVDRASPKRSKFARNSKDLGSLAVFFLLSAIGLYLTSVLVRVLGLVNW